MLIQIVLFHGFDELDVIAPFEVLKNAAAAGANLQVELVTLDDTREIIAAHGLQVRVADRLGNGPRPDILLVPVSAFPEEALSQEYTGTEALSPHADLVSNLHGAYSEDTRIVERVWMRLAEHVKNEDSTVIGQKDERNGRILDVSIHKRKGLQPVNH